MRDVCKHLPWRFSKLVNRLIGGTPWHSISGQSYANYVHHFPSGAGSCRLRMIDFLFSHGHCRAAYLWEINDQMENGHA